MMEDKERKEGENEDRQFFPVQWKEGFALCGLGKLTLSVWGHFVDLPEDPLGLSLLQFLILGGAMQICPPLLSTWQHIPRLFLLRPFTQAVSSTQQDLRWLYSGNLSPLWPITHRQRSTESVLSHTSREDRSLTAGLRQSPLKSPAVLPCCLDILGQTPHHRALKFGKHIANSQKSLRTPWKGLRWQKKLAFHSPCWSVMRIHSRDTVLPKYSQFSLSVTVTVYVQCCHNTELGSCTSGHNIFINPSIYNLVLSVFQLKDPSFNVCCWFINVELMVNRTVTHARMEAHLTQIFSIRHSTAFLNLKH